jgi:ABC-type branched-subunit amino acid transport system permease subunit
VVLLTPKAAAAPVAWLLPAAVGAAALYALVVGALSIRTRGVYFIMVTLAFSQMAYYVAHDTPLGGGTDGIYLNFVPSAGPIDLARAMPVYYLTLAALVAVFVFLAVVMRSRFGPRARRHPRERAAHARRRASPPTRTSSRRSCCRARSRASRAPLRREGRFRESRS